MCAPVRFSVYLVMALWVWGAAFTVVAEPFEFYKVFGESTTENGDDLIRLSDGGYAIIGHILQSKHHRQHVAASTLRWGLDSIDHRACKNGSHVPPKYFLKPCKDFLRFS